MTEEKETPTKKSKKEEVIDLGWSMTAINQWAEQHNTTIPDDIKNDRIAIFKYIKEFKPAKKK